MASVSAQKFLSHAAISPSASPYGYRAPSTCWHPPPLAGVEAAEHENYENLRSQLFTFRANHAVAATVLLLCELLCRRARARRAGLDNITQDRDDLENAGEDFTR